MLTILPVDLSNNYLADLFHAGALFSELSLQALDILWLVVARG